MVRKLIYCDQDLTCTHESVSRASLQSSLVLLSQNLKSIQDVVSNNSAFLSSAHVYPNPHFPAQTNEAMLQMLLRKKLGPSAEDWIVEGRRDAFRIRSTDEDADAAEDKGRTIPDDRKSTSEGRTAKLDSIELRELWSWAGPTENEMARKMLDEETLNDFTFEEQEQGVENVVTGVRRKLWESDSEDEEDEDEGSRMEGVEKAPQAAERAVTPKSTVPMDAVFRYMSTGNVSAINATVSQIQRL